MYFKELHHRLKNNLQVISSLLFLQSTYTSDPKTLAILNESQSRVKAIALIHEKLYRSPELTKIDFAEYIRDLVADLFRTYSVSQEATAVRMKIENISLEIDTAIPCGLIINELVSNVLKHAFPAGQRGQVVIDLSPVGNREFTLIVQDDGVGLPKDYDWRTSTSLGLKLVSDLTWQLDGKLEIEVNRGTTFRITFKELQYKERS
jgi:two-component sensor histidine kinase